MTLLVDAGADTGLQDRAGNTPVDVALRVMSSRRNARTSACAKILMSKDAPKTTTSNDSGSHVATPDNEETDESDSEESDDADSLLAWDEQPVNLKRDACQCVFCELLVFGGWVMNSDS